jgi:CMP/dCMP kinase
MIRIITIDREYGSGAGEIAKKVAHQLGWKLWDQLLTTEIARLMDCECRAVEEREERRDAFTYRLFKAFLKGSFEGTLNASRMKMVDADCIREASEAVVRQAGGSAYYLTGDTEAFHIFLYAPIEEKVRRLEQQGKSEGEAYSLAENVDRDRAAYIKQYFKVDWPFLHMYDLMINTAMGDDTVVDTIMDSVTRRKYVSGSMAR